MSSSVEAHRLGHRFIGWSSLMIGLTGMVMAAAACADGGAGGSDSGYALVVESADGSARLLLPDDALPEGIARDRLSVKVFESDGRGAGDGPASITVELAPDGLTLSAPARLEVRLASVSTPPMVVHLGDAFLELPDADITVDAEGLTVGIPIDHFSHVVVFEGVVDLVEMHDGPVIDFPGLVTYGFGSITVMSPTTEFAVGDSFDVRVAVSRPHVLNHAKAVMSEGGAPEELLDLSVADWSLLGAAETSRGILAPRRVDNVPSRAEFVSHDRSQDFERTVRLTCVQPGEELITWRLHYGYTVTVQRYLPATGGRESSHHEGGADVVGSVKVTCVDRPTSTMSTSDATSGPAPSTPATTSATASSSAASTPQDSTTSTVADLPTGRLPGEVSVEQDDCGHEEYVGPMAGDLLVLLDDGSVAIEGAAPFVRVHGELGPGSWFEASGSGTVAGHANTSVVAVGVRDNDGWFLRYWMGLNGELGAGCPIEYLFDLGGRAPRYPPDADIELFVSELAGWFRTSDVAALLDHLHPVVRGLYGDEQCAVFLGGVHSEDLLIGVRGVGAPEIWRFVLDGVAQVVNDAVPVSVSRSEGGTTTEAIMHVGSVGGRLRWFVDCGRPLG